MGLRKIDGDGDGSFMYTNTSIPDEIQVILLRDNNGFSVKLGTDSEPVKKWCKNLQKSPDEYMTLIHKAVESCSVTYSDADETNKNKDVFEIQEDSLVWKQFFPDKNVFGRRGKFALEKIDFKDAVKEILNGAVQDLDAGFARAQKLAGELDKESKELQRAKDLAAKSVQEKESFEKEIYGKCASIINAKKLRIKHLLGNQPSTSEPQITGVRKTLTSTDPISQSITPTKSSSKDSDGYSSDTDVDDPDVEEVDTDEENFRKTPTQKRKITSKLDKFPVQFNDSQDSLFNDSLEAELYSKDFESKKQKVLGGKQSKAVKERDSNGKTSHSVPEVSSSSDAVQMDTQRSIIDELF
ncbi:uncharacterized protein [Palaemon carinicauda]|uniref:uncharacterized protein n=1 Tax=Palaemon carinicauda TaxID=392227 RepID=UPI0035B5F372